MTKSEEVFRAAINKRAAADEALRISVKQKAEEELDIFYDARVDKMALRQSENRDQEENMLEDMSKVRSPLFAENILIDCVLCFALLFFFLILKSFHVFPLH